MSEPTRITWSTQEELAKAAGDKARELVPAGKSCAFFLTITVDPDNSVKVYTSPEGKNVLVYEAGND